MDRRWQPLARDAARAVTVALYAKATTPAAILAGEAPLRDLTPFASRIEQSESQLTVTLCWHDELDGAASPYPGQWLMVNLDGMPLCVQRIEGISDYRVSRGEKAMTVLARSRDAAWRETRITTRTYALGTPTALIVRDIALQLGMQDAELVSLGLGTYVTRSAVQLSGISAWAALEQVMHPSGLSPMLDALGRLYGYSRDVLREADVSLTSDRVESFAGSRAAMPITSLTLRWRAPKMATVAQPERVLGETSMGAGFFKLRQVNRVYFSEDRTQRATDLRLRVVESVNRLLPVAEEHLEAIDTDSAARTGAAVVVTTRAYVPALLGTFAAGIMFAAATPDGVAIGVTIPRGRVAQAAATLALMILIMSVGHGQYQVLGKPLKAVQPINEVRAFDPAAPIASQKRETIESDFVNSEGHAQAFATREFIYRARAATSFTFVIVDDPRLQVGDLVQFDDGTRLFVTGFRRDLSPGTPARMELTGFPA